MEKKIRIGILGYGNLGRGAEKAVQINPDMELVGVFTRRDPKTISCTAPVYRENELLTMTDKIDVLILCGGSATDLPKQSPAWAEHFHMVDSFDNHSKIPEHFDACDKAARETNHISLISTGWDPGLFSMMRVLFDGVLPQGQGYTFWGKGVSQGHSDAIRRVAGVQDARQYTVPVESALEQVRSGSNPVLSTGDKHKRVCYVVAEPGADKARIENEIKTMPAYFADYDTTVHFITAQELQRDHSGIPHGGFVIHTAVTGQENKQKMEFSLALDSNPEFTASVLVACARAAMRFAEKQEFGAKTILDIPPAYLSPKSAEILRKEML
jgi:diaminopimelate dehydrogenase